MHDKKKHTEKELEDWRAGKVRYGCQETVFGERMWDHQCQKGATAERNGWLYCKTHDPVRVNERREARNKKWAEERAQKERKRARRRTEFTKRVMATTAEAPAAALVDEILSAGFGWWR